jgi:hypothetical protein
MLACSVDRKMHEAAAAIKALVDWKQNHSKLPPAIVNPARHPVLQYCCTAIANDMAGLKQEAPEICPAEKPPHAIAKPHAKA